MRTSDPDIFALGDAVEVQSPVLGKGVNVPLAGPATKQARIVAENLALSLKGAAAEGRRYAGALGTSIAKVFDLTAAATGANEKSLRGAGIPFEAVITHGTSHAGYYPGALPLTLKVLFDPATGRLLGAQAVGYDGVDKRIDLLAETLRRKGTVSDLAEIEHAYAPPFSSSKDPVNILGMVGENVRSGLTRVVHWHEVGPWKDRGAFLLDVRSREEFALGSIPGAHNIPNNEVRNRLEEIPKDRPVLVFCAVGLRGYLVERILRQHGWTDLANLTGGYKTWELTTARQASLGDFQAAPAAAPETAIPPAALAQVFTEGTGQPEELPKRRVVQVDACGLQCPGPIMRLKKEVDQVPEGTQVVMSVTDPGFARDVASWCRVTGNLLQGVEESKGVLTATIEKRIPIQKASSASAEPKGATFIVFSDDLDRALATFILANGAAASGKPTTLFFTFWGLSVLKRREKAAVRKDLMGRLFGWMLPSHPGRLALSKMDFLGVGRGMMKGRMKAKGIDDLETLIASARKAGVRLVACQMTMDLMGIAPEELVDGVEIGGVATYMEAASGSDVNLFI
jgi:peroxiredoxin family protein/rhodanese-related sulfurtransferase/TusA-related sulfurtransferase